jgi:hypothetical protein
MNRQSSILYEKCLRTVEFQQYNKKTKKSENKRLKKLTITYKLNRSINGWRGFIHSGSLS